MFTAQIICPPALTALSLSWTVVLGEPGALGMAALTWFVSWSPTSHQHCSELLGV